MSTDTNDTKRAHLFKKGNQAAALSPSEKRTIQLKREAAKMARKSIVTRLEYALDQAIPRLLEVIRDRETSPRDIISAMELLAQYTVGKPSTKSEVTLAATVTTPQATVDKAIASLPPNLLATMLADLDAAV